MKKRAVAVACITTCSRQATPTLNSAGLLHSSNAAVLLHSSRSNSARLQDSPSYDYARLLRSSSSKSAGMLHSSDSYGLLHSSKSARLLHFSNSTELLHSTGSNSFSSYSAGLL
jgi:hypothetical protein